MGQHVILILFVKECHQNSISSYHVPVIRLFGVDPGPVVNIKWDAWTLVFLYKFHKNFELAFKEICHRLLKRAEALSWRNTSNYSVLIPLKLEY